MSRGGRLELEVCERDVQASRQHVHERAAEIEAMQLQLDKLKQQPPTQNMAQLVTQLRTQVDTVSAALSRQHPVDRPLLTSLPRVGGWSLSRLDVSRTRRGTACVSVWPFGR